MRRDTLISCADFTATSPSEAKTNPKLTCGAYNVLVDLVNALASDVPGNTVKYTLLPEKDLALAPALATRPEQARAKAVGKVSPERSAQQFAQCWRGAQLLLGTCSKPVFNEGELFECGHGESGRA